MMTEIKSSSPESEAPDVILHIGAPKTGSSAIQRFCRANRELLERCGFYYPDHPVDANEVSGGHSFIAGPVVNGNLGLARRNFDRCLKDARARDLPLLLSSEAFYRRCDDVAELMSGVSVRVVAFFRDPVEAIVSGHNQQVKRHFQTRRLVDYCVDQLSRRNLDVAGEQLLAWAAKVGDVNCRFLPYHSYIYQSRFIEKDFLGVIGVGSEWIGEFSIDGRRINRSYVPEALELKRLMNSVFIQGDDAVNEKVDIFLQAYSDAASSSEAGALDSLHPALLERLSNRFATRLAALSQHFPSLDAESLKSRRKVSKRRVSLKPLGVSNVLEKLLAEHPGLKRALYRRVESKLDQSLADTTLNTLATMLGMQVAEPLSTSAMLTEARTRRILAECREPADFIREFSMMFEAVRDYDSARIFAERAIELRPNSKQLKEMLDRIELRASLYRDLTGS